MITNFIKNLYQRNRAFSWGISTYKPSGNCMWGDSWAKQTIPEDGGYRNWSQNSIKNLYQRNRVFSWGISTYKPSANCMGCDSWAKQTIPEDGGFRNQSQNSIKNVYQRNRVFSWGISIYKPSGNCMWGDSWPKQTIPEDGDFRKWSQNSIKMTTSTIECSPEEYRSINRAETVCEAIPDWNKQFLRMEVSENDHKLYKKSLPAQSSVLLRNINI